MNLRLLTIFVIALSLISCRSKKSVLYFQNSSNGASECEGDYELTIQPDDLLYIQVLSIDAETVKVFNENPDLYRDDNTISNISGGGSSTSLKTKGYLVDSQGFMQYPVLGSLKVAGLTKSSLIQFLKDKLSFYVKDPIVKVRLLNFKVTVLGEVQGGVSTLMFDTEKVSLPQVLSRVGDMSLQSKRNNVMVIREKDGVKTINRVDITQAEIINSPYYYLDQNDVVYIEPRKNKIDSGAVPSMLINITAILTALTLIYVIINKI